MIICPSQLTHVSKVALFLSYGACSRESGFGIFLDGGVVFIELSARTESTRRSTMRHMERRVLILWLTLVRAQKP
jgi:hypothetical protein